MDRSGGYVYNRTLHNLAEIGDTFSLVGLAEPRIEPEIIFKLALAPAPGMDEKAFALLFVVLDYLTGYGSRDVAISLRLNDPADIEERKATLKKPTMPCKA